MRPVSSLAKRPLRVRPVAPLMPPRATGARPARPGAAASPIGQAVNRAVEETRNGTVPRERIFTTGAIEAIWLNDADATRNELAEEIIRLIEEARHEVRIQTYVWLTDDPSGQAIMAALARKQRENPAFKVYVAYDRDRSLELLPQALAAAGVRAETAAYAGLLSRSSNHSKSVIIDGHTAVIGSFNVEDKPMKDVAVKLRGPIVETLLDDFDHAWTKSWLWSIPGRGLTLRRQGAPTRIEAAAPAPMRPLVPMTFLSKAGSGIDGMDPRFNDANKGLLAALAAARREIKLESPNCNDWEAWEAIAAAARRGVKVKVLLPKGFNQQAAWIDRANNDRFLRLIAHLPPAAQANVALRWSSDDGRSHVKSHIKYVSVDGQWAYLGSQNLDNQSWAFSREGGVGIDDVAQVRRLDAALFDGLWEQGIPQSPSEREKALLLPARSWPERIWRWITNPVSVISEL